MDQTTKQYELSYHILPELEGADLLVRVGEVEKIIAKSGGKVFKSVDPKRQHLSYPVDLKHYSNFGVLEFEAPVDAINKINNDMKLQNEVMRYLIIEGFGDAKVLRSLTPSRRKPKTKTDTEETSSSSSKTNKESNDVPSGEMEKQLEDVIEKL